MCNNISQIDDKVDVVQPQENNMKDIDNIINDRINSKMIGFEKTYDYGFNDGSFDTRIYNYIIFNTIGSIINVKEMKYSHIKTLRDEYSKKMYEKGYINGLKFNNVKGCVMFEYDKYDVNMKIYPNASVKCEYTNIYNARPIL